MQALFFKFREGAPSSFNLSFNVYCAQIPDDAFQSYLDSIRILIYTWILLIKHIWIGLENYSRNNLTDIDSSRFFNFCHMTHFSVIMKRADLCSYFSHYSDTSHYLFWVII